MSDPTGYLRIDAALPYCKGCGHSLVLRALGTALARLALEPESVVVVTDIGCVGLADALFATPHTVHTTHGRSTAFATGIALADGILGTGNLKTLVMIGDGGAMIGLQHLVGAAALNPDVTVLVHNNFLFGMTGGQNSAFSPLEFVTATTPAGNFVPPLDLAQVLLAARAPFVARKLATDSDLAEVIARALAHPGFAVVEALELCTAYATRWNPLTGSQLKHVAERCGYALGVLRDEPRPAFTKLYRSHCAKLAARTEKRSPAAATELPATVRQRPAQPKRTGVILAGTAGERVQTAAALLAEAAIACEMHVTQKNDNPVTQGSGFSVSELILSAEPILFTGIEQPDAVLVVSADGVDELRRAGVFERITQETLVLADAGLALPEMAAHVTRLPFRKSAGAKLAAMAAVAAWVERTAAMPLDALWAALERRYGTDAAAMKAKLREVLRSAATV